MNRMNPLGRVLEEALRKLDLSDAAWEARAVMLWPEIVGPQMGKASEARSIQAGTLLVVARSSAWNQEISFQKSIILRRYKEKLGKEFIKDLRVSIGAVRGVVEKPGGDAPSEAELSRIKLPADELEAIRKAADTDDLELAQGIRRALTREAQIRIWRLQHGAKECSRCGAVHRTPRDLCPACRRDDATADAPL